MSVCLFVRLVSAARGKYSTACWAVGSMLCQFTVGDLILLEGFAVVFAGCFGSVRGCRLGSGFRGWHRFRLFGLFRSTIVCSPGLPGFP